MCRGSVGEPATPAERIVSLLPSATEVVYLLGLGDRLVGVTHECDYPPAAMSKPHVISSIIDSEGMTSAEIDRAVRDSLEDASTIYRLDGELLEGLRPDLILTQELCEVCAVSTVLVADVVSGLSSTPEVVSLEPHTLEGVLDSILTVGDLTGAQERARAARRSLESRLDAVRSAVEGLSRPRVLALEWIDPVFTGGHWVPQMIELAGGFDVLGQVGEPSRQVTWRDVSAAEPDIVIAMPCGFGLERSAEELRRSVLPPEWAALPAVVQGQVYVVDGSSFFNRPGPRLVDGVEILAEIFHLDAGVLGPDGAYSVFESQTPGVSGTA